MSQVFNQIIEQANQQAEPQRLLFLFAKADSPSSKTATEKNPKSGTLEPRMCVDKLTVELADFDALVKEADSVEKDWSFVFVAGLSGKNGKAPSSDDAGVYLNKMTHDLTIGHNIAQYVVLDRQGRPIEMMVN